MALATTGSPTGLDLDVAAAGNSNVVRATLRTLSELDTDQKIDDILITLDTLRWPATGRPRSVSTSRSDPGRACCARSSSAS